MIKGFKDFLMRGNVVDLAVAVVIGGAFTALVAVFTKSIIQPVLAVFGGSEKPGWGFYLDPENKATFIDLGAIFTGLITFVITAAVVYFVFVAPMAAAKKKFAKPTEEAPPGLTETDVLLEIRDLLKDNRNR
jgi:large conductance mechanosensitive channel